MTVAIPTDTDEEAWHLWRAQGLGGSDVAAVLGLSPWQSPYSLWAEKVGLTPRDFTSNEAQEFGKRAEQMLTRWFQDRTDLIVGGEQRQCVHPDKPWMRCTIDGDVYEGSRHPDSYIPLGIAEWKTTGDSEADWAEHIPDYYACQATWNMIVTGTQACWLGVLHMAFGRPRFKVYEFVLHEGDARFITDKCERFWLDHVMTGIPPETDAHEATTKALNNMWPDATGQMEADDALVALAFERDQWKQTVEAAEMEVDRINNVFRLALGDATDLKHNGKNLATWRWGKETTKLDVPALLADHPEFAEIYQTAPTKTRTLRVNPPKEK